MSFSFVAILVFFFCLNSRGDGPLSKSRPNFRPLGPAKELITGLAFNQAKELLAISQGALKKYDSKQNKWMLFDSHAPAEINSKAYSLAINKHDDILVGTRSQRGLFRLKSGSKNWESVSNKKFHEHFISHLFVDPKDGQHLIGVRNPYSAFYQATQAHLTPVGRGQGVIPGWMPPRTPNASISLGQNLVPSEAPFAGYLIESTNGGQNWRVIRPPGVKGPILSLSLNGNGAIALLSGNSPLISKDGGKNFEAVAFPLDTLTSFQMTKDGTLIASGGRVSVFNAKEKKWSSTRAGFGKISLISDGFGTVFVRVLKDATAWKSEELYSVGEGELIPINKGKVQLLDPENPEEPFTHVNCVLSTTDHQIWFGTDNGVFTFEDR